MDTTNIKRNNKKKKKKKKRLSKKKNILIKKTYELEEFDSIDVILIICKYNQYTTYRSRDYIS
jgi:hypothetical protein